MDRISRRSQGPEGVRFGDHTISSLLFADDVVVLAPSNQGLQHALGRFAAECEAVGMKISTSKSEAMVLSWKRVACPLQVGGECLPQVEEFKYLGVLFTILFDLCYVGGLFGQQVPAQSNQLVYTANALSAPTLLGDERDGILAKWNQLQAFWGTGKGYFNNQLPPVDFTQENPFCRFKAVGYSCIPGSKDEDGLVVLALNKKEADIRNQQQQLVESLHKVLGGNQTLTVNVEGVKALPDDQTEVVIYIVERSPNGTSKRIPATTLFSYVEQANIKAQLAQLGVFMSVTRTELSPAQLKQLLANPPAGVDPIIWEQAKVDNPDADKFIPVPMVGFKELLRRLKIQDQMTKQHQSRVDIISNDISELQKNQATTVAKIAQYKRKLMDLSHRVLQVLIKQEIQRKSGYAIQVDEEHLRVQLDTIQSELNAPTQFKGRLNELMSQIRMQNHFGAARSEERYSVHGDLLREIRQHLKQQQEGLSQLIRVIKDDVEDLKLIEHGLLDRIC
uniref:54 kDa nucleoporin n=1 Tax=Esox lucius TaxID=8010 RepID=A0A6Q2ZQA7_ESOLU